MPAKKGVVKDGKRGTANSGSSGRKLASIGRAYKQRAAESAGRGTGESVGSARTDAPAVEPSADGERIFTDAGTIPSERYKPVEPAGGDDNISDPGSGSGGRGRRGRGNGSDPSGRTATGTGSGTGTGTADVDRESVRPDQQHIGAEPKPKRTRQPRQAKQVQDKQAELARNAGALAVLYNSAFYGLSLPLGNHWVLTREELFQVSNATAVALDSALPEDYLAIYEEYLQKYAPVVALGVTLSGIISKRVQHGRAIAAKKQVAGNTQEGDRRQDDSVNGGTRDAAIE